MDGWIDGKMDGLMDGWWDEWMDGRRQERKRQTRNMLTRTARFGGEGGATRSFGEMMCCVVVL
jgi:hypothetical protein